MSVFEVLIPIVFFLTVFGITYIIISARNRERLAMIERGVDMSIFKVPETGISNNLNNLKYGLIAIGMALGLIIANILVDSALNIEEPVAYFSMIFLMGGISLIIFYFIAKKSFNRKTGDE